MLKYPAKLQPDGDDGAILVTFADLPEAITGGANQMEALTNAQEALDLALLNHVVMGEDLPEPVLNRGKAGSYHMLAPSAHTQAKMAFIRTFLASGMTRVALAARLGKAENEVRRMLDPHHATKLPALEAGLLVFGQRLVVAVEAA